MGHGYNEDMFPIHIPSIRSWVGCSLWHPLPLENHFGIGAKSEPSIVDEPRVN